MNDAASRSSAGLTTLCGSLSRHPVSLGARMHRAGYEALGLDYDYIPFATRDLSGALQGMRALGIRGFGISMPFKIDIIPMLDELDPLARRIGAVNTVVNDQGILTGHNTDAWGAARALEETLVLPGKRVMIIGAGGAARAVACSLCTEQMRVRLVNRTVGRAQSLCQEINETLGLTPDSALTAGSLDELTDLQGYDAVVNCSSAGMLEYESRSPIPEQGLFRDLVVMDIVYKPIRTELVELAERQGARVIHGGRMLLHQAARQFELYTGHAAPLDAMDSALRDALGG